MATTLNKDLKTKFAAISFIVKINEIWAVKNVLLKKNSYKNIFITNNIWNFCLPRKKYIKK